MDTDILLSLCIPTNGVLEWVKVVLDSIYEEENPTGKFEVVITDNGSNKEFELVMNEYMKRYSNIVYKKTDAQMFLNQIEAFKLANGKLIKFINHRMRLLPGALNYLINYAREHEDVKPVTYFLNSAMALESENIICNSFNEFVYKLSYWSSWSAGTSMWKTEFDKMNIEQEFNPLFPHMELVFNNKDSNVYIIDNRKILEEIPSDISKKGKYDVFNAFAVEYVKYIEGLYKNGYIEKETFEYVKKQNFSFVSSLYFDYIIRKNKSSYDLSGYEKAINVYYSDKMIKKSLPALYRRYFVSKLKKLVK